MFYLSHSLGRRNPQTAQSVLTCRVDCTKPCFGQIHWWGQPVTHSLWPGSEINQCTSSSLGIGKERFQETGPVHDKVGGTWKWRRLDEKAQKNRWKTTGRHPDSHSPDPAPCGSATHLAPQLCDSPSHVFTKSSAGGAFCLLTVDYSIWLFPFGETCFPILGFWRGNTTQAWSIKIFYFLLTQWLVPGWE